MGRMGRMPTQAGSGEEREAREAIHVHWDADDLARVLDAVKAEGDAEGYQRAIAALRDSERYYDWLASHKGGGEGWHFTMAANYLEAQTKPAEVGE